MESALLGSEDQWISRLPEKPCKINKFRGAQCFRYVGDQVGGVSASPADGPGALGSKRCDSNQGWACRAMCGWRHGGRCAFSAVHAFVSWTDCPSHPTPCRIQGIVFDLLLIFGANSESQTPARTAGPDRRPGPPARTAGPARPRPGPAPAPAEEKKGKKDP